MKIIKLTFFSFAIFLFLGFNTSAETTKITNSLLLPTASFTVPKDTFYTDEIIKFTNTSANAVNYIWDFGDNYSSLNPTPTHYYSDNGTYTVELIATSPSGVDTFSLNIVVVNFYGKKAELEPGHNYEFFFTTTTSFLPSSFNVDYSGEGENYFTNLLFNWLSCILLGSGNYLCGARFYYKAASNTPPCSFVGTFTITFYKFNNSHTIEREVMFIINPSRPEIQSQTESFLACNVTDTLLSVDATGDALEYQWFKDDDMVPGADTSFLLLPSLSANDTGYYTCKLKDSFDKITFSDSIYVGFTDVLLEPSISINASDSAFCFGQQVEITAATMYGGISPVYHWLLNGDTLNQTSNVLNIDSLKNGDVVICSLTSSEECVTENTVLSDGIEFQVYQSILPAISISTTDTNICDGQQVEISATAVHGGDAPTYRWFLNGFLIDTSGTSMLIDSIKNDDVIHCSLTSSEVCAAQNPVPSNELAFTVNENLDVSVEITASAMTICGGEEVEITATPANGGDTPSYQWLLNGSVLNASGPVLVIDTLEDNDVVNCSLNSSEACTIQNPVPSNTLAFTVNDNLDVSVGIEASAATICDGEQVEITASPEHGGLSPTYQWFLNGNSLAENGPVLQIDTLDDNDLVHCSLTSSEACTTQNPVQSNELEFTVNENLDVSVGITASANILCEGDEVEITATPANEGSSPSYQWFLNGSVLDANGAVLTIDTLKDNDVVHCSITSSEACTNLNPVSSNELSFTVNESLDVSTSITASATAICEGGEVEITATMIINGGDSPSYQWFLNDTALSVDDSILLIDTLEDGDVVYCSLTSSKTCTSQNPVQSNTLAFTVSENLDVSIGITASADTICEGDMVEIVATPEHEGASPAYQWFLNDTLLNGSGPVLLIDTLDNDDVVHCSLTSSEACTSQNPVLSNTLAFSVNENLDVSIGITASADTICEGDMVEIVATPEHEGASPAYQWFLNDTLLNGGGSVLLIDTLDDGDAVHCLLTSSEECTDENPASSNPIVFDVNDLPQINCQLGADTFCLNDAGIELTQCGPQGGAYMGSGVSSNVFEPSVADTGLHLITYEYTDSVGCINSVTQELFVEVCTAVMDRWNNHQISVFPNPSNGIFKLKADGLSGEWSIRVINELGQKVFNSKWSIYKNNELNIYLKNAPKGNYWIVLINNEQQLIRKIILQ